MSDAAASQQRQTKSIDIRRAGALLAAMTVAFIAGLVAVGVYLFRHDAAHAEAGDCVAQIGANSVEVVSCDDPGAAYEVIGRVEGKAEIEAGTSVCGAYADQGVVRAYWQGTPGRTGFVLCLASLNR